MADTSIKAKHHPRHAGSIVPWLLALLSSIALAGGSAEQATITEIKNRVDRRVGDAAAWQVAHVQDVLLPDNSVRTGADAIVELTYGDESITRLAPSTTLTLRHQKQRILHLLLGKIWVRLSKGGIQTRIHTPSAIATIVGTDVLVEVTSDQTSTFTVMNADSGHRLAVQAINPLSNAVVGTPSVANSAQRITVEAGRAAPPAQPVNVQQIIQQQRGSGLLRERERQPAPSASATAAARASDQPSARPSGQPSAKPSEEPNAAQTPAPRPSRLVSEPSGQVSPRPTSQPAAVVSDAPVDPQRQPLAPTDTTRMLPSAAPPSLPPPTLQFDPVRDAPILPSRDIERTGSGVTGDLNVIFEHDGAP